MVVEFWIIILYKKNKILDQLKAARIVTGATKLVSFQALYDIIHISFILPS